MPNHCYNYLGIFGNNKQEVLKCFKENSSIIHISKMDPGEKKPKEYDIRVLDFEKLLPIPESCRKAPSIGHILIYEYIAKALLAINPAYDQNVPGIKKIDEIVYDNMTDDLSERVPHQKDRIVENMKKFHGTKLDKKQVEYGLLYLENILKFGCTTWYPWCNSHWGTKWNAYNCEDVGIFDYTSGDTKGYIYMIYYQTAWNDPVYWLKELSKKYPELTFYTISTIEGINDSLLFELYINGINVKGREDDKIYNHFMNFLYKNNLTGVFIEDD